MQSAVLRLVVIGAAALVATSTPAHAQDLAAIDSLLARGRFTDARTAFARWREEHPASSRDVTPDMHARALLLEGRMATSPAAAIDAYLGLVLGYPTAAEAPAALLLLGQGLLATGQPERARGYLERLARDYPTAPERPHTLLWLARAQVATARTTEACATLADAAALRAPDADVRALIAHEQRQACSGTGAQAAATQSAAAQSSVVRRLPSESGGAERAPVRTSPAAAQPGGRWTVQAGAFRDAARAERLVRMLSERGFTDARIVYVPANELARVRLGHFTSSAEAAGFAQRLRAAGFEAAVANDARDERTR